MLNNIGLPGLLLIAVVVLVLFGRGKISRQQELHQHQNLKKLFHNPSLLESLLKASHRSRRVSKKAPTN